MRDVAFIFSRGIHGTSRIEIDVTRRTGRVVVPKNRLQRWRAIAGRNNGTVNAVSRVVREFAQQEQLRKRAVLQRHAFSQPSLRNSEELWKEPGLVITSSAFSAAVAWRA